MESTIRVFFQELRDQTAANPSLESRATAVLHKIGKMYREALTAQDWDAVKIITEELARNAVPLGQAISAPQIQVGREKSGRAGTTA